MGNKVEEELLLEKLKEDFLNGDYILSEKMQTQLKSEKPLRFNKIVLNGESLNEPLKVNTENQKNDTSKDILSEEDRNEPKKQNEDITIQEQSSNDEGPKFVAINNTNKDISQENTVSNINQDQTNPTKTVSNIVDQNEKGQSSTKDFADQDQDNQISSNQTLNKLNNQIINNEDKGDNSDIDDEQVLSAYDKFMKEIDDINKKIIFFDKKSSEIKEEYVQVVDSVYEFLRAHPKIDIKITGYASQKEGKSKFMQLSIDRSNNVANYLLKKGIKKTIMKIKS